MSDKDNRISQVVENRQHIIKHCRGKMFTSESLKIVALICMLIDHAGATLFPQCDILRSIGRVSFPLYAFLLAQGCKHTQSMARYLVKFLMTWHLETQLISWIRQTFFTHFFYQRHVSISMIV